jgi:phage terminase Nu1 subunit (DNA packaging protein)
VSDDERKLLTRRELAELRDVHPQTVTKWESEGLPVAEKGGPGRPSHYDPDEVADWLASREASAKNGTRFDLVQERARKERAQAQLAELNYQERLGELLEKDDVAKTWESEVAAARAILLAVPQTWADRIHRAGALDGVAGVERELRVMARETLRELTDPERDLDGDAQGDELETATVSTKTKASRKK